MRPILTLFPALVFVPFALSALPGCDGCNKASTSPAPSAQASAAPSVSASAAAAPSASVGPSGKMAHCPNAVTGSKTDIHDIPGGVALTITSNDATGLADIRARTQALLDAQKNQSPNVRHTGNGEGGGLLGRCPVVLKETLVAATDVDNGSKITVTTKDSDEVDWLRRETRDREEDLEAAGSPAGAGKMSHCPSAVVGATTTLKNTSDGVSVVVTASDDAAVKAIRERSKHLAEVANAADASVAEPPHTGEGGGGGGIGRCPVVVKATTLKVKDVPGGSQVDVKAKVVGDVPKLQTEAKERAAKFQLPAPAPSASAPH